jgi:lipopolysaccharide biosynthesis glycosyltransferase
MVDDADKIHFFLLGNLSNSNKEKLLELKKIQICDITFSNVDTSEFLGLPEPKKAMSNRLFIPDILPEAIEKVIYLDCDTIVNVDIKRMWDIDVSNYLIAAVKDRSAGKCVSRVHYSDTYFNSGVIIFNLKKLRDFGFSAKWRNYVKFNETKNFKFYDQDIWNAVIPSKDILFLPVEYNLMVEYVEMIKNIKDAVVIHFGGWNPWQPTCTHPLRHMYWDYVKLVPYRVKKEEGYLKYFIKFVSRKPFFFLKLRYWKAGKEFIMYKIKRN